MSEVQSIIKDVQASGTWDSPHGLLYKFDYHFEDGTVIQANHKTQEPIPAGSEAFYTVKRENNFGKSGKVSRTSAADFGGAPSAPQSSAPRASVTQAAKPSAGDKNRAFALSYAKDIAVAHAASGVTGYGSNDQLMEELFLNADKMAEWLNK